MSRRYKPIPSKISKETVQNIISNLKLESLEEIHLLNDRDIHFLIRNISSLSSLDDAIRNHENVLDRPMDYLELRQFKINYLLESLLRFFFYTFGHFKRRLYK